MAVHAPSAADRSVGLRMLYGLYEPPRDLVVGDIERADDHARDVVAIERWLHLFAEADVQHAAHAVPGLTSALGTAYLIRAAPARRNRSVRQVLWLRAV